MASDTYEMVDKHIRRLDGDLLKFEEDIRRRLIEIKGQPHDAAEMPKTPGAAQKKGRKRKAAETEKLVDKSTSKKIKTPGRKSKKGVSLPGSPISPIARLSKREKWLTYAAESYCAVKAEELAQLTGAALFQQLAGEGENALLDMPVDPNEPTYCLCHQVSYGEMVGCDNKECPIEWFHFGCVGLSNKPKGKWFCPKCTEERKKK